MASSGTMTDDFAAEVTRLDGYRFEVAFPGKDYEGFETDETDPPGDDRGPNPSRLLAAAVGNCLSASLLFCLGKSRIGVDGLSARVEGHLERDEDDRLRVAGLEVTIDLDADAPAEDLERCIGMFEEFCIVTQSVRRGIDVDVAVETSGT